MRTAPRQVLTLRFNISWLEEALQSTPFFSRFGSITDSNAKGEYISIGCGDNSLWSLGDLERRRLLSQVVVMVLGGDGGERTQCARALAGVDGGGMGDRPSWDAVLDRSWVARPGPESLNSPPAEVSVSWSSQKLDTSIIPS